MSEFKAACGHMATAKQLGQICPECHAGLYEQISLLVKEIFDARDILTSSVMGRLPDEWSLKDVCEARLHDIITLRNQVRDTCVRAEKSEGQISLLGNERGIAASLAAAISLLENSPKRGAPSNKMFDTMVSDYKKSLEEWRAGMGANCAWYDDGGTWASGCGVFYGFNDGGPVENEHIYCIKCGKKVLVVGDDE